jgi:sugar lactone lactonase YvrE
MFAGRAVIRWNPESGKMIQKIEMPVPNPTSCTLGGDNLDEMYITSARLMMTDEEIEKVPIAGGLFRCRVDVPGTALTAFDDVGER